MSQSPHLVVEHVRLANQEAMRRCLADASFKTYDSGWRSWQRCADFYGFNVDCLLPDGKPMDLSTCCTKIDLYIGFECGLRQINPNSISGTYIPGIAKRFMIHKIINNFKAAAYHDITKTLLDGYIRIWHEKFPDGQNAKIPFTMVLALQSERFLRSGDITYTSFPTTGEPGRAALNTMRMTSALLFGIFFLLRKGEFLPQSKSTHAHRPLLRSHLRFMDSNRRVIPYHLIGHVRASWLTLTITFSKTDQTGHGRIITHHIDTVNPVNCIVQRMEAYIIFSRDNFGATADHVLFDVPGFPSLSADLITDLMRRTCELLGLPFDKISAHSLRYGGATTLAAAGFPEYVIDFYGGWAHGSRAMRTYIKPTDDIIKRVSLHMTQAQASLSVQNAVNQILAGRLTK